MKKIKVFEAFAGIGAQHKALQILKENNVLDFEIVGTSEWDAYANISYDLIHNENKNNEVKKEIDFDFLNKFTHSLDSKKPIKNLNNKQQDVEFLKNLNIL